MNNNKALAIELSRWEANGYDDSDGGSLYYVPSENACFETFWTTRGYCGVDVNLMKYDTKSFDSSMLCDGTIDDARLRNVLESLMKKSWFNASLSAYPENVTLNIPITCESGRGFRGRGILKSTYHTSNRDIFGRTSINRYAIIFDVKNNTLKKTRLYNVEFENAENVTDINYNNFIANATIDEMINVWRASKAQFSGSNVPFKCFANTSNFKPICEIDYSNVSCDLLTTKSKIRRDVVERNIAKLEEKLNDVESWARSKNISDYDVVKRVMKRNCFDALMKYREYLTPRLAIMFE